TPSQPGRGGVNRFMREFRLLPVVLFATASLLALKVGGLVVSGGYTFTSQRPAQADGIPAPDAARAFGEDPLGDPDVTGSVAAPKPAEKDAAAGRKGDAAKPAAAAAAPPAKPDGTPVRLDSGPPQSPAERAVLERLQQRRQELDQRARELDIREG